ncbi:MAG TPA: phage holin family protein [Candidatus Baltobacterales bacterium]|nr:phage holin family protein [Candidatus Baltobacterales bacterium]
MQSSVGGKKAARPSAGSGELASEVVQDAQRLMTLEVALAKQEVKELVMVNAIAAGMMAGGGLVLMLAIFVTLPVAVVTLVPWHWQAALTWTVAYAVIGIALVLVGKSRLRMSLPAKTIASLKESKEWALRRMRSTVR